MYGKCDMSGFRFIGFNCTLCIARRWDCNLLEEVAGLLFMARTAVSSAKVSDEVGRSAVNSKYTNGVCLHEWERVQCTRFQS
jgi:hypothetical protein